MNYLCCSTIVAVLLAVCHAWDNDYDKELYAMCANNYSISGIESIHDNHHEDRRFSISCRLIGELSSCHDSGYVNNYDAFFTYQCPGHGFICGMQSIHDNHHEDRIWGFRCCERMGFTVSQCYNTHYTEWDAYWNSRFPYNEVLRGVTSAHNNHHEDREYSFELCKLVEH